MTMKIAVSLPDDLVEQARAGVARGEFASISAYIADAIRRGGRRSSLAELLAEMDEELGPPSAEDEAWAEAVLGRLES